MDVAPDDRWNDGEQMSRHIDGKECGLDLTEENAEYKTRVFTVLRCPLGHRSYRLYKPPEGRPDI
jgi:hypothetical protein